MGAELSTVQGEKARTKEQIAKTREVFTDIEDRLQSGSLTEAEAVVAISKRAKQAPAEWRSLAGACTNAKLLAEFPNVCAALANHSVAPGDDFSGSCADDSAGSLGASRGTAAKCALRVSSDIRSASASRAAVAALGAAPCDLPQIDRSVAQSAEAAASRAKAVAAEAKLKAEKAEKLALAQEAQAANVERQERKKSEAARKSADDAASEAKSAEAEAKKEAAAAKKESAKIAAAVKKAEKECDENSCGERSVDAQAKLDSLLEQQKANEEVMAAAAERLKDLKAQAKEREAEIESAKKDCAKVEARKETERVRVAKTEAKKAREAATLAAKEAKDAARAAALAKAKCEEKSAHQRDLETRLAEQREQLNKTEQAMKDLDACANDCVDVESLQAVAKAKQETADRLKALLNDCEASENAELSLLASQVLASARGKNTSGTATPAKIVYSTLPANDPRTESVTGGAVAQAPAARKRSSVRATPKANAPTAAAAAPVAVAVPVAATAAAAAAATVLADTTKLTPGEVVVAKAALQQDLSGDLRAGFRRMRYLQGLSADRVTAAHKAELAELKKKYPKLTAAVENGNTYRDTLQYVLANAVTGQNRAQVDAIYKQLEARYGSDLVALLKQDEKDILSLEQRCLNVANPSADVCDKESCDFDGAACFDRDFRASPSQVVEWRRRRLLNDLVRSARASPAQLADFQKFDAPTKALLYLAVESAYEEARRQQYEIVRLEALQAKETATFDGSVAGAEPKDYTPRINELKQQLASWRAVLRQSGEGLALLRLFDAESRSNADDKCVAIEKPTADACDAQGCDFYEGGLISKAACYDGELRDYNNVAWFDRAIESTPLSHARANSYLFALNDETKLWQSLKSGVGQSLRADVLFARLDKLSKEQPQLFAQVKKDNLGYVDLATGKEAFFLQQYNSFADLYDAVQESAAANSRERDLADFMSRRIYKRLGALQVRYRPQDYLSNAALENIKKVLQVSGAGAATAAATAALISAYGAHVDATTLAPIASAIVSALPEVLPQAASEGMSLAPMAAMTTAALAIAKRYSGL